MQKSLQLYGIVIVTIVAVYIFSTTLVHAVWYAPEATFSPAEISAHETFPSANSARDATATTSSMHLEIPKLAIDAAVQSVGLNSKGSMGVPNNFTDAAWYKYGPVPGEQGSAVIDGHVDNGLGLSGVFKHLNELQKGDDIYVVMKDGMKVHFRVSSVASYYYDAVPTDKIFITKGEPRLVLITCDGGWVQGEKTYDHRLVVSAALVAD